MSERRSKVKLVRERVSLWNRDSGTWQTGQNILRYPFRFILPESVLPTYEYKNPFERGAVHYAVQVVCTRSRLHFNKKATSYFPVLPQDSAGAGLREQLLAGWKGSTTTSEVTKQIRKGIWGDHSTVVMRVRNSVLLLTTLALT